MTRSSEYSPFSISTSEASIVCPEFISIPLWSMPRISLEGSSLPPCSTLPSSPVAKPAQEEPQGQPEQGRKEYGVVIASVHQMTGPIVVVARSCFLGRMFLSSVLRCRARVQRGAEVKRLKDAVAQK